MNGNGNASEPACPEPDVKEYFGGTEAGREQSLPKALLWRSCMFARLTGRSDVMWKVWIVFLQLDDSELGGRCAVHHSSFTA